MVEEALSSPIPNAESQTVLDHKTQIKEERAPVAKKTVTAAADGKVAGKADKKQKLISHLFIGFLMAVIAIAGYAFLGPQARASAAETAGNHFVDVGANQLQQTENMPTGIDHTAMSDMATIQAEMDAITQQMNAIKVTNMPNMQMGATSYSAGSTMNLSNMSGSSPVQATTQLEQMKAMLNQMMQKTNAMNGQSSGMGTTSGGSGHSGHH